MQATIQKWGNSSAVRIPKTLLITAGLSESEPIQILAQEGQIVIVKNSVRKHLSLRDRLAAANESASAYQEQEEWDSSSVGEEVFW